MVGSRRLMDYQPDQRGRCMTCGFLAQRSMNPRIAGTSQFFEVTETQRNAWMGEVALPSGREITVPVCYVRAFNIEAEYNSGGNSAEMVRRMFDKDRHCPKWYSYTPGFSPKEHLEQQRAEQAERNRREFEQRLENSRRGFEIKITAVLGFIALLGVPWWPQLFSWISKLVSGH